MKTTTAISHLVQTAITLDVASLHWTVQLTPTEAIEFAHGCKVHYLAQHDFIDLISNINATCPTLADGTTFHTFTIGREYKRVVYVDLVHAYKQKFHPIDWQSLIVRIKALAEKSGCTEFDVVDSNAATKVRIYWS